MSCIHCLNWVVMCCIFAGPSSSCGIPCEAAYLFLACSTCGLSGLRWGGGLVVWWDLTIVT